MRVDFTKILLALAVFCIGSLAQAAGYYDNDYYSNGYYNNDSYSSDSYGYGYGSNYRTVTCESHNQRTVYCGVDTRGGVQISHQYSSGACIEGSTWGYDNRGVWVSGGCRAQFVVGGYYSGNGYGGNNYGYGSGYGSSGRRIVRCESVNSGTTYCRTGSSSSSVRLIRQLSQSACVEGSTWGRDRRGEVWVSDGCRGEFRVSGYSGDYYGGGYGYGNGYDNGYGNSYGNGYGNGYGYGYGSNQRVICESRDGRYNFCRTGYIRQAQIYRQLSSSRCQYQYNWGYRSDGVWVNNGCRAEFLVY